MESSGFVDFMKSGIKNMTPSVDASTIIGDPVSLDDEQKIFPIMKLSSGQVSGGGEYYKRKIKKQKVPFAGVSTSGFIAEPVGFLVVGKNYQNYIPINDDNVFGEVVKNLSKAVAYFVKKNGQAVLKKSKGDVKNAKK